MKPSGNKAQPSPQGAAPRINCYKCKHFYVTWEPSFPKGCRSYGIKTSDMPSSLVLRSSGKPCLAFEGK